MRIERLTIDQIDDLAVLFDAYRMWYGQTTDVVAARQFLQERLKSGESVVFGAYHGARHDGRLVGFTQLYPTFSSVSMASVWTLNDLFVIEAERGSGIGLALLGAARAFASGDGALRLELATAHDNLRAQRLYEGLGYVLDDDFRHYSLRL